MAKVNFIDRIELWYYEVEEAKIEQIINAVGRELNVSLFWSLENGHDHSGFIEGDINIFTITKDVDIQACRDLLRERFIEAELLPLTEFVTNAYLEVAVKAETKPPYGITTSDWELYAERLVNTINEIPFVNKGGNEIKFTIQGVGWDG